MPSVRRAGTAFLPRTTCARVSHRATICIFGQYVGYTFKEIFQKDTSYCDWVLKTYESGDKPTQYVPFSRLAKYTAKYEAQVAHRDMIQDETGFHAIGEEDSDLDV